MTVSESDLKRSREDPRFKQILLAKSLEQLLASLHRLQTSAKRGRGSERALREGARMAVVLADRIRALEEQLAATSQTFSREKSSA